MPSDKGGLGRTGNKHKRNKAPPAPHPARKEGQGPRGQRPGLRSADSKPPKEAKGRAALPSRVEVMMSEAARLALTAEFEVDLLEARMKEAEAINDKKKELYERWEMEFHQKLNPVDQANDVLDISARLALTKEGLKLSKAAARAERVMSDIGLELEAAIEKAECVLANFQRCQAAYDERAQADAREQQNSRVP